jgi:hypothetical protein
MQFISCDNNIYCYLLTLLPGYLYAYEIMMGVFCKICGIAGEYICRRLDPWGFARRRYYPLGDRPHKPRQATGSAAVGRRMDGLMMTKDGVWAGTDDGRMAVVAGMCTVKPLRGGGLAG